MSRANVELVRSAFQTPGPLSDFDRLARDAEFDLTSIYPDQPVLRGVDALRSFRDAGPWGASIQFEPERYFDVDEERVLVFIRMSATGRGSGVPVDTRVAQEFRLRDGLIVYVKVHPDRSAALRAMGLQD
jgi:hypothetical protein